MATELASAYISLIPSARGMKGNITSELSGAGTTAAGNTERAFGKASSNTGSKFKAMFSGVATGGAVAIGGAFAGIAIGKELLGTGAELEAWKQKAATVFEGSNADVQKWADNNAESFGMTDDQLAGQAASFGDLLKPMGFTSAEAANMSKEVVGLSGALSSWSGGKVSAAAASDTLAKAMLGERDGLKELGISISQNEVDAKLAAKGQDKLTGAALAQAQAVATQELIFAKSTDAQKAFAKGGNGALQAQNKLKAQFGEMKETLATKLTPALTSVAAWMGDKLPKAFDAVSAWWKVNGPTVTATAKSLFEGIQKAAQTMSTVIGGVVDVIKTLWANFGDNIMSFTRRVWGPIQQYIGGVMTAIQGIIKTVTSLIHGDWAGVWEGIKQTASGVWNAIQGLVKYGLELIRLAISVTLETLDAMWSGAWDGIKKVPGLAMEGIRTAVSWGIQWVIDRFTEMPEKVSTAAEGLFDGIKNAFKAAINWIIRTWNDLSFTLPSISAFGKKIGGNTISTPDIPTLPPDIPTLHSGGIYRAPPGATEGLALLRDGEEVLTPGQRGGSGMVFNGPVVFGDNARRTVRDLELWSMRNAQAVLAS